MPPGSPTRCRPFSSSMSQLPAFLLRWLPGAQSCFQAQLKCPAQQSTPSSAPPRPPRVSPAPGAPCVVPPLFSRWLPVPTRTSAVPTEATSAQWAGPRVTHTLPLALSGRMGTAPSSQVLTPHQARSILLLLFLDFQPFLLLLCDPSLGEALLSFISPAPGLTLPTWGSLSPRHSLASLGLEPLCGPEPPGSTDPGSQGPSSI